MDLKSLVKLQVMSNMRNIAYMIRALGEDIIDTIRRDFEVFAKQLNATDPKEKYWLATVMSSVWIVGVPGDFYRKYIAHIYKNTVNTSFSRNVVSEAVFAKGFPGTLKYRVVDMLVFHGNILNTVGAQSILQNPVVHQRSIVAKAMQTKGVGQWSATAPFMALAAAGELPQNVINDLEPPLGTSVIEGIKVLTGVPLRSDDATHREFAKALHRHLAELANTDVFTINGGLYELGRK